MDDAPTQPNWHLQDWLLHFGKIQRSLITELGWETKRANLLFHGTQPYKRKDVNDVAAWLGLEPFEILLEPNRALAIREMAEVAERMKNKTAR